MDDNAGLFFPSVQNPMSCPNSLIFNPYNRIEQSVIGPFVYGNSFPTFNIPYKHSDDFRLTLPKVQNINPGPTLYIDGDGTLVYQPQHFPLLDNQPDEGAMYFMLHANGSFLYYIDPDNEIRFDADTSRLEMVADGRIFVYSGEEIIIQNFNKNKIHLYNNGDVLIDSTGKVDIKASTTVNIGPSATMVNIAGGSTTLSKSTHTHTTGNMGMPIPPHDPSGGTIKSKAT